MTKVAEPLALRTGEGGPMRRVLAGQLVVASALGAVLFWWRGAEMLLVVAAMFVAVAISTVVLAAMMRVKLRPARVSLPAEHAAAIRSDVDAFFAPIQGMASDVPGGWEVRSTRLGWYPPVRARVEGDWVEMQGSTELLRRLSRRHGAARGVARAVVAPDRPGRRADD